MVKIGVTEVPREYGVGELDFTVLILQGLFFHGMKNERKDNDFLQ